MTPQAQRIAIAEACGWICLDKTDNPNYPYRKSDSPLQHKNLPDYLNDLNAMHEAEKVLTEEQWVGYINRMLIETPGMWTCDQSRVHISADAKARCFLRAIGKWNASL